MEPYLNDKAVAALYSPDAGIVTPYEFTIAVAENAVDNGARLQLETEVVDITPQPGGFLLHTRPAQGGNASSPGLLRVKQVAVSGLALVGGVALGLAAQLPLLAMTALATFAAAISAWLFRPALRAQPPETLRTRFVVNAAGLFADKVSAMVGANDFKVSPPPPPLFCHPMHQLAATNIHAKNSVQSGACTHPHTHTPLPASA